MASARKNLKHLVRNPGFGRKAGTIDYIWPVNLLLPGLVKVAGISILLVSTLTSMK